MIRSKHFPFFLLSFSILLLISGPQLFSDGMFMDGLWYATIARNMSEGIGTFWDPQFTECHLNHFYQHPPLAFGIQAAAFSLFGDSIYVERIYSLFAYLLLGFLMIVFWRSLVDKKFQNLSWVALLFWVLVPSVTWALPNNMLENTLMLFSLLACWFFFKSLEKNRWMNLVLMGLMILLSIMTKGPVALFPLAILFWTWMVFSEYPFKRFFVDMAVVSAVWLGGFLLLLAISTEAQDFFSMYLESQILNSFQKDHTVGSRFFIVFKQLEEFLPALVMAFLVWLLTRNKPISHEENRFVGV